MASMEDRVAARRKNFKKAVDPDEARRKREDEAIQLRKAKKDEALMKKRFVEDDVPGIGANVNFSSPNQVSADEFQQMIQALSNPDHAVQFQSVQKFRKLLCMELNPPIQEVIDAGVVPTMINFLKEINRTDLQFEAAWVLTNIASGSQAQTTVVVQAGGLPLFVELLNSPNEEVREQAVWALGNIAGDSPDFRDQVLQAGGILPLMHILRSSEKTSLLRNATWTLSNFCRGKPQPKFEMVHPALELLAQLVTSTDHEVLTDACWALSYMSDGEEERIQAVLNAVTPTGQPLVKRLVDLMTNGNDLVQTPALRALGNIVTGSDTQTQAGIDAGALPALGDLLTHRKKAIKKEACWTISNITAGNVQQIQSVIDAGLLPPVIKHLQDAEFDIKKEAAWVISNASTGGNKDQVAYMVQCGCIKPVCALLAIPDLRMVSVALDAIDNILRVGEKLKVENSLEVNPFLTQVEEHDGVRLLEELQNSNNNDIYNKAMNTLHKYWEVDEEDDIGAEQFNNGIQAPQGGFNFAS